MGRAVYESLKTGQNVKMGQKYKYARIERERRFLVYRFACESNVIRIRRIHDRYIDGTRLRLRAETEAGHDPVFKLTQKIPERGSGAQQGLVTTMYLSKDEFFVFAQLPAKELTKTRYSVPPFGVDVFGGELDDLILAEAEFDAAAEADSLEFPAFIAHEVSADDRFTGSALVRTSRAQLRAWLSEYGINRSHK
jgi:CYTH domain-containing protein